MGREQTRRVDARKAKQLVQSGQAERRALLPSEASAFFWAINKAQVQHFGIKTLSQMELNDLFEAPKAFPKPSATLLDFAAWRGRDSFAVALIAAKADPSEGAVDVEVFDKLPRAYTAWLARAAVRMRHTLKEKDARPHIQPICHVMSIHFISYIL